MIEIIIHGLGGQGAVTAAHLIASAAFYDGKYSQAFPMFGVERQGTPVQAFVRIDNKKINLRSQIYKPDYNVVLTPKLIENIKHGKLIVNSKEKIKDAYCVPVEDKLINTAMVALFGKITKLFSKKSLLKAVEEEFKYHPDLVNKNKEVIEKYWK